MNENISDDTSKYLQATASCLCGAVGIEATSIERSVGACHCSTCRQWGGGPLMTATCGDAVTFSGDENVSIFSSSEWAERGFCASCGTHLFYKFIPTGEYFLPIGLFDLDTELNFDHQVFVDERPSFYCFANKTTEKTGAELFAEFADN